MNEWVGQLPGQVLSAGAGTREGRDAADAAAALELDREFEARLADCGTLAVRLAYSVLRQQQDAEDVAQEAFARAHRRFHQLRDRGRFRAWLARMVWRLAIDRYRHDRRRTAREQAAVGPLISAPGEVDAIARERADLLWQAIDTLSEKQRIVTVLCAMDGHTIDDVATLLGLPAGTVKSRLFDARKNLQEALKCLTR